MSEDAGQKVNHLVDHLFRHESGKMVAALTRLFGIKNISLAEDIVQDTLLTALRQWAFSLPENPTAWLYRVARNRAIDLLRRETSFRQLAPDLVPLLSSEKPLQTFLDSLFLEHELRDDMLRLMFVCCHPRLSAESQTALILKTLCGFSVSEIAQAFLTNEDTIYKRLQRAKEKFREQTIEFAIPTIDHLESRLTAVYQVLYLLYNEGYYSTQSNFTIREDLCFEALRLTLVLQEHPAGDKPVTCALIALMCFHSARLKSRVEKNGDWLLLADQDRSLWDERLIQKGVHYLQRSAAGQELTEYHLEAGIAAIHCLAKDFSSTDWKEILRLYDLLVQIKTTPVIELNRAIAMAKALGPAQGLHALDQMKDKPSLSDYPLLPAAYGDLFSEMGNGSLARHYYDEALRMARTTAEERVLQKKIGTLGKK